jgi:hypothetical protein
MENEFCDDNSFTGKHAGTDVIMSYNYGMAVALGNSYQVSKYKLQIPVGSLHSHLSTTKNKLL